MQLIENKRSFVRKPVSHKASFAGRFGATYFVTICCHKRHSNQLCEENVAHAIFETATRYEAQRAWYLRLLLLMPDHLHALISIGGDASLSRVIANFKRATTKFAGVGWQRNFFDHRLRHDESLEAKGSYIRQNPVRAGLIRNEEDWPFALDRRTLDMAGR